MRTDSMATLAAALAGEGETEPGKNPETIPVGNPTGPGLLDPPSPVDGPAPLTSNQTITTRVQFQLENLPMPGGLLLPLFLLLGFWFLLIPVNGHTRAVWLWLTLTGNASISAGGGGGGNNGREHEPLQTSAPSSYVPMPIGSYVQESF